MWMLKDRALVRDFGCGQASRLVKECSGGSPDGVALSWPKGMRSIKDYEEPPEVSKP
jgi:hypothetical protein